MTKEVLGGFEHQVLLAALRIGPDAYTASVVDELAAHTGREPAPAAVYIALQRLEAGGLMRSDVRVDPDAGDRRPRRYFEVTGPGRTLLASAQGELRSLWRGLRLQADGR